MRRADLLPAHILRALDETGLPASLAMCTGCGQIVFTLGDLARHREVIDPEQPPTWENSGCRAAWLAHMRGLELGDDIVFTQSDHFTYQHTWYVRVHRLGHNGEARYSYTHGSRHAEDCVCHTDPLYQWFLDEEVREYALEQERESA